MGREQVPGKQSLGLQKEELSKRDPPHNLRPCPAEHVLSSPVLQLCQQMQENPLFQKTSSTEC